MEVSNNLWNRGILFSYHMAKHNTLKHILIALATTKLLNLCFIQTPLHAVFANMMCKQEFVRNRKYKSDACTLGGYVTLVISLLGEAQSLSQITVLPSRENFHPGAIIVKTK